MEIKLLNALGMIDVLVDIDENHTTEKVWDRASANKGENYFYFRWWDAEDVVIAPKSLFTRFILWLRGYSSDTAKISGFFKKIWEAPLQQPRLGVVYNCINGVNKRVFGGSNSILTQLYNSTMVAPTRRRVPRNQRPPHQLSLQTCQG